MEEILFEETNQKSLLTNKNKVRRTLWTDILLWSKINNYISGRVLQGDFTYRNFSDFVRAALTLYRNKELQPIRYRLTQRKQVGVTLDNNLNNFYLSLPMLMRTQIINDLLNNLLIKEAKK